MNLSKSIYPVLVEQDEVDEKFNNIKHSVSKFNAEDCFYTIPVCIPKANNKMYGQWSAELKENIKKTMLTILEIREEILKKTK